MRLWAGSSLRRVTARPASARAAWPVSAAPAREGPACAGATGSRGLARPGSGTVPPGQAGGGSIAHMLGDGDEDGQRVSATANSCRADADTSPSAFSTAVTELVPLASPVTAVCSLASADLSALSWEFH